MPANGTRNYNREIARNPGASSHRASTSRTYVMQQLGVQTPGFWADWAKRTINPKQPVAGPYDAANATDPKLSQMPQYKSQKWDSTPSTPTDLNIEKYQSRLRPGGGGGPTKGNARENLIKAEKAVLSGTIKFNIQSHPMLTSTVMDTMTATAINMDRQMSMYMEDNPGTVMSQAAMDYYKRHPQASAAGISETNFEKQISMYSETQQMAAKRKGYAANKTNEKLMKMAKEQKPYSAPQYVGGTQLNIGSSGGYRSTPYLSPYG